MMIVKKLKNILLGVCASFALAGVLVIPAEAAKMDTVLPGPGLDEYIRPPLPDENTANLPAGVEEETVRITTIIENEDEIPAGQKKNFKYKMIRYTTETFWYMEKLVFVPRDSYSLGWNQRITIDVVNGQAKEYTFPAVARSKNNNYETPDRRSEVWENIGCSAFNYDPDTKEITYAFQDGDSVKTALEFSSYENTDVHYSLVRVEYDENQGMSQYQYDNKGLSTAVKPYNWIAVEDANTDVKNITLYFRYNGDIQALKPEEQEEPDVIKEIDYLGDGVANPDTSNSAPNDYRVYMTLDTEKISNDVVDKDILFMVDISNTMRSDMGGVSRLEVAKTTLKEAVQSVLKNPSTRVSIITFGSKTHELCRAENDVQKVSALIDSIQISSDIDPTDGGGTNYANTFQLAGEILDESRGEGKTPSVFFLTDGAPESAYTELGTGATSPLAYMYALRYADLINAERIYSVFIGTSAISGQASNLQSISQFFTASEEKYVVRAENKKEIQNALDRFIAKFDKSLSNVTMKETLSEHVNYMNGLKMVYVAPDGTRSNMVQGKDYSLSVNGNNIQATLQNKTERKSKYILSFNVQSSRKAYDDWIKANKKYPQTGDKDTDYPKNNTSSGKGGFFVSKDGKSSLTYEYAGAETVLDFKRPVVQLKELPQPFTLNLRKVLEGKPLTAGMFTFQLRQGDKLLAETTNDAQGNISFPMKAIEQEGVTYYQITEVPGTEKGLTYDKSTLVASVTTFYTTSDGTLRSLPSFPTTGGTFTNIYKPEPVKVDLKAKKVLQGDRTTLTDGEFTFELLDNNGSVLQTATNDAAGNIKFTDVEFDEEGTYILVMKERPGTDLRHIKYDIDGREITIVVTDDGGQLKADVQYPDNMTFKNIFTYVSDDSPIKMKVILTGQRLSQGRFTYCVKAADTNPVPEELEVENKANGDILLNPTTVKRPGTYEFTVYQKEDSPVDKYMTYDSHVGEENAIKVTITVEPNAVGDLIKTAVFDDTDTFRNHYQIKGNIW